MSKPLLSSVLAVVCFLSTTVALPSADLLRKWNHGPEPIVDTVRRWIAMGDSFSAGPGAGEPAPGDTGTCRRRLGAYPPQLQAGPVFADGYSNPPFTFASCTGDQVPQVLANQLNLVTPDTDLVTLSIGGNDIQFVPILTACVLSPFGNCDATIANARNILYGAAFHNNWQTLFNNIVVNSGWLFRNANARRTLLYLTSYPPFFDSWTGQCNTIDFFPGNPTIGSLKLTNALRDKLNLLGQELNAVIAYWTDDRNYQYSQLFGVAPANAVSVARFSNQDERYNGHRFCRDGVSEPDRNNPNTWFFNLLSDRDTGLGISATNDSTVSSQNFTSTFNVNPNTCNANPATVGQGEFNETLPCVIAKAIASGDVVNTTLWPGTPEAIQKTFHPRIAGFHATEQQIEYDLLYELPGANAGLHNKQLRIMALGDDLGFLDGNNIFFDLDGYRGFLRQLLTQSNSGNQVQFVGTQRLGSNPQTNQCELYLLADLPTLTNRIQANQAVRNLQPNVVLITAGTTDIRGYNALDYNRLNQSRANLEILINTVYQQCTNCMVLVGDTPPPGAFQWPPTDRQKQALQFNAMIAEIVNKQQTLYGRRVGKVHLPVANADINPLWPNADGYNSMAYEIVEKLWESDLKGWINTPVAVASTTAASTPTAQTSAVTAQTSAVTVQTSAITVQTSVASTPASTALPATSA